MIIGNCPVCGAEMRVGTDMTNADRIRAMTDEELAVFIEHAPYPPNASCSEEGCKFDTCVDCWLDWLKQESGE